MCKTAQTDKKNFKADRAQIACADMHCDTLTACFGSGRGLDDFDGQVNTKRQLVSRIAVQCYAIFTEGKNSAADFESYAAFFFSELGRVNALAPAVCLSDIARARAEGRVAAVLTVENLGFLGGDVSGIARLAERGVKMASLAWNNPNAFTDGENLTRRGERAAEELEAHRIIVDLSHLADGATARMLDLCRRPPVASHSNARAVCPHRRNLPDELIRRIADMGGAIGLNFSRTFLGDGDALQNFYRHFFHVLNVGGEDCVALGSDFDGIIACKEIPDCTAIPRILAGLSGRGVPERIVEKFALGNFLRVFGEVVG